MTLTKVKSDSTAPSVCVIVLLLVTGQAQCTVRSHDSEQSNHGQQTAPDANC